MIPDLSYTNSSYILELHNISCKLKVLTEIHRVVQKPDNFYGVGVYNPVEDNMPCWSTGLPDMVAPNARAYATVRPTAPWIARDGELCLFYELGVLPSLGFSPVLLRVLEGFIYVSLRLWRADYTHHLTKALRIKAQFLTDLRHELFGGTLLAKTGVEFSDAYVESLTESREPLLVECTKRDLLDAAVLTGTNAFLREGLKIFGKRDRFFSIWHG